MAPLLNVWICAFVKLNMGDPKGEYNEIGTVSSPPELTEPDPLDTSPLTIKALVNVS